MPINKRLRYEKTGAVGREDTGGQKRAESRWKTVDFDPNINCIKITDT